MVESFVQNSLDELNKYCTGRSVLLVGNGQGTTTQSKGSIIDNYDIVIRMNHGFPRPNLAKHMGAKTSIWSCAFNRQKRQIKEYRDYWHQVDIIVRFGSPGSLHKEICETSNCFLFVNQPPHSWYVMLREQLGARPSTGVMTAYLFCEKVESKSKCDLIGFDHFAKPNPVLKSHSPNRFRNSRHQPKLERQYIDKLLKRHGSKKL